MLGHPHVRHRLRPAYPNALNQEPRPFLVTDIEMIDLSDTESATPHKQSNRTSTADTNTDMSYHGDDSIHDGYPQTTLEDAPDLIAHPSNVQPSVVFDSDAEDSDDDVDQDRTPRLGLETPPSPGSMTDTGIEQTPRTGKFGSPVDVSASN